MPMRPSPLSFDFCGQPVGCFDDGVAPQTDGLYRYQPFRGPGHLRMQQQLNAGGTATCHYQDAGSKVSFVVRACPEYGVLDLCAFTALPE